MQELESSQVSACMDPFCDPKGPSQRQPLPMGPPLPLLGAPKGHDQGTLTPTEGAGKLLLICPRTVERQEHWDTSSQEQGTPSCSFCVTKAA